MKDKVLYFMLGVALTLAATSCMTKAIADSGWQPNEFRSSQYVLNKCYESATNSLSIKGV